MKSSGQTRLPTASSALQRADRADRQHPVAALLDQRPQVRVVVDLVREHVGVAAVALDDRRAVLGRRRGDLLAARARARCCRGSRPVVPSRIRPRSLRAHAGQGRVNAATASSWSTIGAG